MDTRGAVALMAAMKVVRQVAERAQFLTTHSDPSDEGTATGFASSKRSHEIQGRGHVVRRDQNVDVLGGSRGTVDGHRHATARQSGRNGVELSDEFHRVSLRCGRTTYPGAGFYSAP